MSPERKQLTRFIDKATDVIDSRYAKEVCSITVSLSFNNNESTASSSRIGPDEESIKAAVLTIRFFYQNNESISLRRMCQFVSALSISDSLKTEFAEHRKDFNDYLDSDHGPVSYTIGCHKLTSREIFEAFMYGKYAHLTKSETVEGWENLLLAPGIRAGFDLILHKFIQTLIYLREICQDIDRELADQEGA